MAKPRKLDEFLQWEPGELTPIIDHGILYEGTRLLFYGRYKSMKSMMIKRMALAISRGENWMGFSTTKGPVIYLQTEIPEALLHKRLKVMTGDEEDGELFIWSEFAMTIEDDAVRLNDALREIRPSVLIIDPVYKFTRSNMLDQQQVSTFTKNIDKVTANFPKMATVLVTHSRKSITDDRDVIQGSDDMLGSVIWSAWADSIIRVQRKTEREFWLNFTLRHAEQELGVRKYLLDPKDISFVPNIETNPEISLNG